MGVAAGDEVDPVNLRRYLCVADFVSLRVGIIAEVRHPQHQLAAFLFAQKLNGSARRLYRIKILQRLEILSRNQSFRPDAQAKQSDPQAVHFFDQMGLDLFLERAAAHVIIS